MLQIYKASAGSGKTYTLAYKYIRSLLGAKGSDDKYRLCIPKYVGFETEINNRHRYILAITFTNKATEEMKRRIIDELDDLSTITADKLDSANYAKDLCKEFGCLPHELAEVATRALRQLLHDYSSFNVATIDSFFQRVLRTFARELDHQGDFNVEINDRSAVQNAVNTMLDDFNADPAAHPLLDDWIYQYMRTQLENGEKSNFFNRRSLIHSSLVGVVANICEERFKPYAEQMRVTLADPTAMPRLKAEIKAAYENDIADIKAESQRVWGILASRGLTIDSINGKLSKIKTNFSEYFCQGIAISGKFKDTFTDSYDNQIHQSNKVTFFPKKTKATAADIEIATRLLKYIRDKYVHYSVMRDMYRSIDHLILLGYAWQYLTDFISQNNVVLLSDTNHLLSRIIGHDPTPFIYERMGAQFRHFLIDEFQDTSKMQWQNLKPLVANGLDNLYDSLIIGDEKQSIYRFRNSDSSLLHYQVANVDFPVPAYDTQISGNAEGENTNYRSAADVVEFNNTLFSHLAHDLQIEGYGNVVQTIRHTNLQGYVRFIPTKAITADVADDGVAKSARDVALMAMTENIMLQHREGKYPLREIAVLVFTNKEGSAVVDHLISKGIPVTSDESLLVRKSPAVKLVINALEIISGTTKHHKSADEGKSKRRYPTKAEVTVALSQFGFMHNVDETGENTAADIDKAIRTSLYSADGTDSDVLDRIQSILDRKPASLTTLVEIIINELVPEELRRSQTAFLTAFQDYVMDFTLHNPPTVHALLNHWASASQKLSVSSASEADAVKVMTIHKSKGLEFGCVHIPFGSWPQCGSPRGCWLPFPPADVTGFTQEICPPAIYINFENNEDYYSMEGSLFYDYYTKDRYERYVDTLNLTYVAYTRAERELTVYYDPAKDIGVLLSDVFARIMRADSPSHLPLRPYDSYDRSTGALSYGLPTVYKPGKNESTENDTINIDHYAVHMHPETQVMTKLDDLLDNDVVEKGIQNDAYDDHDNEARERGIILHQALSYIETIDDIDHAVAQTRQSKGLTDKQTAEVSAYLREMLNADDARIRRWFVDNDRAYTEQTIYLPAGNRHREPNEDNKRPDRIVFNHDGSVDVIDYKFTSATRNKYIDQIMTYVEILHDMGYERVNGYLWYPFIPKILPVSVD